MLCFDNWIFCVVSAGWLDKVWMGNKEGCWFKVIFKDTVSERLPLKIKFKASAHVGRKAQQLLNCEDDQVGSYSQNCHCGFILYALQFLRVVLVKCFPALKFMHLHMLGSAAVS